jgi:membrane associated rhomboid family serine protease
MAIKDDIHSKVKSGNPITWLIIINVAFFLMVNLLQMIYYGSGGHSPNGVFIRRLIEDLSLPLDRQALLHNPLSVVSFMFIHGDLLHIFWNMIMLYLFGKIIADYTSNRKIVPLYLYGGFSGAVLTFTLVNLIPAFQVYRTDFLIGASASAMALIIASATLVPNVKLNLILIGPVRLIYVAIFVIVISIFNISDQSFVVGNLSHIGGALFGYFFIVQYKKGRDMSKGLNRFFDWIKGLFGSGSNTMKVVHKRPVSDEDYNYNRKIEQERLDRILDKISRSSYDSLTKEEKEILHKASRK